MSKKTLKEIYKCVFCGRMAAIWEAVFVVVRNKMGALREADCYKAISVCGRCLNRNLRKAEPVSIKNLVSFLTDCDDIGLRIEHKKKNGN